MAALIKKDFMLLKKICAVYNCNRVRPACRTCSKIK